MSSTSAQQQMTLLLRQASQGEEGARSELLRAVYGKLHGMAENKLRSENAGHSLQATVLVHDAYLQLIGDQQDLEFNDRNHFYVLAAKAMRRLLVDHARSRRALKRGGPHWRRSSADVEQMGTSDRQADEVLALHSALKRLNEIDARQADVVELRHFGGYTVEETADLLSVSPRTVKNDYAAAKAWLYRELAPA